ncbi:hypothetical protein O181_004405 [Austropuccinia psidii MF-1]|uniref:Uncharacterized protein n=1 Tax=Austropuccinia psidii MF-1 TaxID=1389203 RepID=A0A9Q3BGB6_9BASI|nr:hypothetical protein [Austropuccinia psidii MF-1]
MKNYFKYSKERWDKSHNPPDFKIGDLVLVSILKLNEIKGRKKLKYSFEGPFMIRALHVPNAVQLELTGELMSKHPDLSVSLRKPYRSSDEELFPLRNRPPLEISPLEEGEENKNCEIPQRKKDNKQKRKKIPCKVQKHNSRR